MKTKPESIPNTVSKTVRNESKAQIKVPVKSLLKMCNSSDEESDKGELIKDDGIEDDGNENTSRNHKKRVTKLGFNLNEMCISNAKRRIAKHDRKRRKKQMKKAEKFKKSMELALKNDDDGLFNLVEKMGNIKMDNDCNINEFLGIKKKTKKKKKKQERNKNEDWNQVASSALDFFDQEVCKVLMNLQHYNPCVKSHDITNEYQKTKSKENKLMFHESFKTSKKKKEAKKLKRKKMRLIKAIKALVDVPVSVHEKDENKCETV